MIVFEVAFDFGAGGVGVAAGAIGPELAGDAVTDGEVIRFGDDGGLVGAVAFARAFEHGFVIAGKFALVGGQGSEALVEERFEFIGGLGEGFGADFLPLADRAEYFFAVESSVFGEGLELVASAFHGLIEGDFVGAEGRIVPRFMEGGLGDDAGDEGGADGDGEEEGTHVCGAYSGFSGWWEVAE